jgi:hypothetical protein
MALQRAPLAGSRPRYLSASPTLTRRFVVLALPSLRSIPEGGLAEDTNSLVAEPLRKNARQVAESRGSDVSHA